MMDVPADPSRNTRTRILDVFSAHLAAQGYGGVSLDAVAREVGIRKPSLYHHFPEGKESVYREAALQQIAGQVTRMRSVLETGGALEDTLVGLASLHLDVEPGASALDQQIYDATRHVSDYVRAEGSRAYVGGLIGPVVDLMRRAVDDGSLIGDPSFLAWSFLGLASSVAPIPDDVGMPPDRRGEQNARSVQAVVDLFLDGARAR